MTASSHAGCGWRARPRTNPSEYRLIRSGKVWRTRCIDPGQRIQPLMHGSEIARAHGASDLPAAEGTGVRPASAPLAAPGATPLSFRESFAAQNAVQNAAPNAIQNEATNSPARQPPAIAPGAHAQTRTAEPSSRPSEVRIPATPAQPRLPASSSPASAAVLAGPSRKPPLELLDAIPQQAAKRDPAAILPQPSASAPARPFLRTAATKTPQPSPGQPVSDPRGDAETTRAATFAKPATVETRKSTLAAPALELTGAPSVGLPNPEVSAVPAPTVANLSPSSAIQPALTPAAADPQHARSDLRLARRFSVPSGPAAATSKLDTAVSAPRPTSAPAQPAEPAPVPSNRSDSFFAAALLAPAESHLPAPAAVVSAGFGLAAPQDMAGQHGAGSGHNATPSPGFIDAGSRLEPGFESGADSFGRSGFDHLPMTQRTLAATPNVLEVGITGGPHGWLRVRAELGHTGEVTASLMAPNSHAAESLRQQLPGLSSYLQGNAVAVGSLAVTAPEKAALPAETLTHAPGSDSTSSDAGSARDQQGRAADDRPTSGQHEFNPWDEPSAASIAGHLAVSPALLGGSSSGGWLNVTV